MKHSHADYERASLATTDVVESAGCRITQDHEKLEIRLTTDAGIYACPGEGGGIRLHVIAPDGVSMTATLDPVAAGRLGHHVAAIAANQLDEAEG